MNTGRAADIPAELSKDKMDVSSESHDCKRHYHALSVLPHEYFHRNKWVTVIKLKWA